MFPRSIFPDLPNKQEKFRPFAPQYECALDIILHSSCCATPTQPLTSHGMWIVMSWGSNKIRALLNQINQSLFPYNLTIFEELFFSWKVLKGHRLALAAASHSLKHLSMAFLLSQLPTLTVGMILSGWSHWTKRFSSRKLLCSLYGIPARKGNHHLFSRQHCSLWSLELCRHW